jgi:hypothetical protein
MDVDVEPLESQAYTKAKEAAQHTPGPSVDRSSTAASSSLDNQEELYVKRRRPNKDSNPASLAIASRPGGLQHVGTVGDAMSFAAAYQAGLSDSASTHQSSPRGSGSTPDVPVKYTPITNRVSKAKKGVRIHTCDTCNPPKVAPHRSTSTFYH